MSEFSPFQVERFDRGSARILSVAKNKGKSDGLPESYDELLDLLQRVHGIYDKPGSREFIFKVARKVLDRYEGERENFTWFLPVLLKLDNKPYTIREHFYMEPLFVYDIPDSLILRCGRQVTKSSTYAAAICVHSVAIPNFRTLYVAPLQDHTRKFSRNYLAPFLASLTTSSRVLRGQYKNVLQKNLTNGSRVYLHYAYTSADRIRGLATDKVVLDEIQLMDMDLLPIIDECMSHSIWVIRWYSGTPKTSDNPIEMIWESSSQAEWRIPCSCGRMNYPTIESGVLDMIQKEGLICAGCKKLLDPGHDGCVWEHRVVSRRKSHPGYHIPQVIVPIHYKNPSKWKELYTKKVTWPLATFANEVLGEAMDVGTKPVTLEDIKRASDLPWGVSVSESRGRAGYYVHRMLSVDWGGGGVDQVSTTAISILGVKPPGSGVKGGRIDVLYMRRLMTDTTQDEEVAVVLALFREFRCSKILHDFGGVRGQDILLLQAGLRADDIVPFWYVGGMRNTLSFHSTAAHRSTPYYALNKAVSIKIVCNAIKNGFIHFPKFEASWPFTRDFMALAEESHRVGLNTVSLIVSNKKTPDDFVHSITFGAMTLWLVTESFPDLASAFGLNYRESDLAYLRQGPGIA